MIEILKYKTYIYDTDNDCTSFTFRLFHILGEVRTTRVLDRESSAEYWLTAVVRDGGDRPKVFSH